MVNSQAWNRACFGGCRSRSCPCGCLQLLWRRKQGCAVTLDSVIGMLVLGGQGRHHLQFNHEMEMSRESWTRAGSPGSGLQHSASPPPSKQQCSARRAGSLRSSAQRVPRGPRTHPQQNWPVLGQELQAAWQEVVVLWGRGRHWPRRCFPSSKVWLFSPHRAPAVGTVPANVMSLFSPHSMTEKEVPEPPASPASGGKPKSRVSGCPWGSLGGWGKPPF